MHHLQCHVHALCQKCIMWKMFKFVHVTIIGSIIKNLKDLDLKACLNLI